MQLVCQSWSLTDSTMQLSLSQWTPYQWRCLIYWHGFLLTTSKTELSCLTCQGGVVNPGHWKRRTAEGKVTQPDSKMAMYPSSLVFASATCKSLQNHLGFEIRNDMLGHACTGLYNIYIYMYGDQWIDRFVCKEVSRRASSFFLMRIQYTTAMVSDT